MINQQASSSNSTNDMVTVSGNNTARNLFRTPADTRAGDDTDLQPLQTRTPQGNTTFMQHLRQQMHSRPTMTRFKQSWMDFLPPTQAPNALNQGTFGPDPSAPAPIAAHSSIRPADVHKLSAKVNGFDGHWEKFSLIFDLHPSLHTIHTCKAFKLPYPTAVENPNATITDIILNYGTMGDVDRLDIDAEEQDYLATSAISRLSINAEGENQEDADLRREQLAEIEGNQRTRNKLVKMHRCNKIVCNNIMAYWGCLKLFTSENISFRHESLQIPLFDVWTFKDALFAHFRSDNSILLDKLFTDFMMMRIRSGQDPIGFVEVVEKKAQALVECGYHGEFDDTLMKTRIWRGLTGRQTIQDFLYTWFQDPTISYFRFRSALRLRSDTVSAISHPNNSDSKKRSRDTNDVDEGRDFKRHTGSSNFANTSTGKGKAHANSVHDNSSKFHSGSHSKSNSDYKKRRPYKGARKSFRSNSAKSYSEKPNLRRTEKWKSEVCSICDRPGHTAERCFSNPNNGKTHYQRQDYKPQAKSVSFRSERDDRDRREEYVDRDNYRERDNCRGSECDEDRHESSQAYYANTIEVVYEFTRPGEREDFDSFDFMSPAMKSHFAGKVALQQFPSIREPIRPKPSKVMWDSGCTHLMFKDAGVFTKLSRQITGHVKVAGGEHTQIRGYGTVALWRKDPNDGVYCVMKEALYVPGLHHNLAGDSALTDAGIIVRPTLSGLVKEVFVRESAEYMCALVESERLYYFPDWMFYPQFDTDDDYLASKQSLGDAASVLPLPFDVRRGKAVSTHDLGHNRLHYCDHEAIAQRLQADPKVKKVSATYSLPPYHIDAELPAQYPSYRMNDGKWKKAVKMQQQLQEDTFNKPTDPPTRMRYDHLSLGSFPQPRPPPIRPTAFETYHHRMLMSKPKAPDVDVGGVVDRALGHLPAKLVRKPSEQGPVTAEPLNPNGYPAITVPAQTREELTADFETYLLYLHRATGHMPLARLRHHLEQILPYPREGRRIPHEHHCDVCLRAKMHRESHRGNLDSGVYVGDHHSVDLQGPFMESQVYENIYKCGLVEYKSRHVKMYFIKKKSDVYDCIEDYLSNEVANLRARNPTLAARTIALTSDVGESVSNRTARLLASKAVLMQRTIPHTPEQNGIIERVWGTIGTMATAMLADSGLDRDRFWEEASRYATFIYNHMPPTGKGPDGKPKKSPIEIFYEMGPSLLLHYIRPFGCVCYAHVPIQSGGKGHEDKATLNLFMGFEDNTLAGYRLYNRRTNQFFHNSATFPDGPDLMKLSIPRATVQAEQPMIVQTINKVGTRVYESEHLMGMDDLTVRKPPSAVDDAYSRLRDDGSTWKPSKTDLERYSDGDRSRRHEDSATSSDSDSDYFDGDIAGRIYRQLKDMPEPRKASDAVKKKPRGRARRSKREGIAPGELGLSDLRQGGVEESKGDGATQSRLSPWQRAGYRGAEGQAHPQPSVVNPTVPPPDTLPPSRTVRVIPRRSRSTAEIDVRNENVIRPSYPMHPSWFGGAPPTRTSHRDNTRWTRLSDRISKRSSSSTDPHDVHEFRLRTDAPDALITGEDRNSNPQRARGERAWPKHARPESPSLPQPDADGNYNIEDFRYLEGTQHYDPEDGSVYETLRIVEEKVI